MINFITNLFKKKKIVVPFVDEVLEFNIMVGRIMPNDIPSMPSQKDFDFLYNFIKEELEELKESYDKRDIIGCADAIADIQYVSTGNGTLLFGLRSKLLPIYAEVQRSNMSKASDDFETANRTSAKCPDLCRIEALNGKWLTKRIIDDKVIKSIKYSPANLKQFFTEEELANIK